MKKFYPVIHYKDIDTTEKNLELLLENNIDGAFLINMDCDDEELNPSLELAKLMGGENFFVGVNRLHISDNKAGYDFLYNEIINDECADGYWIDNPQLYSDEEGELVSILSQAFNIKKQINPKFKLFGSVAFKTQRLEPNPPLATIKASKLEWIPTTSGIATGISADLAKIIKMKEAIGDSPLAIASGITPENVNSYLPYIDYFLVATGICEDFYNFDKKKLMLLNLKIKNFGRK